MFHALAPKDWQLKYIDNHIIIVVAGELTMSYLRVLRQRHPRVAIVVVENNIDEIKAEELKQLFSVIIVIGDITHDYFFYIQCGSPMHAKYY